MQHHFEEAVRRIPHPLQEKQPVTECLMENHGLRYTPLSADQDKKRIIHRKLVALSL